MKRNKYYIGLCGVHRAVFQSRKRPTQQSHGHTYDAVIGPFRTLRGARWMQAHGYNNPNLRTVADAERISKAHERAVNEAMMTLTEGY